jgi:hypothetical protein
MGGEYINGRSRTRRVQAPHRICVAYTLDQCVNERFTHPPDTASPEPLITDNLCLAVWTAVADVVSRLSEISVAVNPTSEVTVGTERCLFGWQITL